MSIPNYCLFFKEGRLAFGLVLDFQKNKWVIQPELGKSLNLSKNQTALVWSGRDYANEAEGIKILAEKGPQVRSFAEELDLEVLHELVEKSHPFPLDELCELALSDPKDGWSQASLLFALKAEPHLFHQKKQDFFARTEEEIELIKAQAQRAQVAQKTKEQTQAWATLLKTGQKPVLSEAEQPAFDRFISQLKSFLFYLEDHQEATYLAGLFDLSPQGGLLTERALLEILALCGPQQSWGALQIERAAVEATFSPETLQEAQTLTEADPFDSFVETVDLRALGGITVDSAETQDYDDGLSLARTDSGLELWLHIADVASYVTEGSALFAEAAKRGSTLYSPLKTYPMLPPVLSEQTFSLRAGEDHGVVSFMFVFDQAGLLVQQKICRAVVHLDENLTYEQLDQTLADPSSTYAQLEQACHHLRESRLAQGALELERKEVKLDLTDLDHIQIDPAGRQSRAHKLIEELAILVNHQAAQVAVQSGRPGLFRNQEPYQVTRTLADGEKPTLADLLIRPAAIGLEASGHAALGLDAYLQCSSPIRRFLDLITQRLLLDHLAQQPASFTPETLRGFAGEAESRVRQLGKLERTLLDHLKIRYLAQNPGLTLEAQLFREFRSGRCLLNLIDLDLKIEVPNTGYRSGEAYKVKLRKVDPALDSVEVEPLKEPETGLPSETSLDGPE